MKGFREFLALLRYTVRLCPGYVVYTVLSAVISTASRLLNIFIPGIMADLIIRGASFPVLLGGAAVFCLLQFAMNATERYFSRIRTALGYAMNNRGTLKIGQKGMRMDFKHWDSAHYMDSNLRAVQGTWIYMGICDLVFENFLSAAFSVAAVAAVLVNVHWAILCGLALLVVLNVLVDRKGILIGHRLDAEKAAAAKRQRYNEQVLFNLESGKEIRAYRAAGFLKRKYEASSREVLDYDKAKTRSKSRFSLVDALFLMVESVAAYLASLSKFTNGDISVGSFLVYNGALIELRHAVFSLFGLASDVGEILAYNGDVRSFLDTAETLRMGKDEGTPDAFQALEFRDVSFTYPGSTEETLHDVSFVLHAKEKLCIVGENGSGKTTLVKLLLRLYDPTSGTVLLNGRDIRDYSYDHYLSLMAPVFQDFQLHAFSLRENICFLAPLEEARLAGLLSAYQMNGMVASLPHGLETSVTKLLDEDGVDFSGGEKQKLAMVRAAYKQAQAIVLDEPTANIDPIAESDFYEKIKNNYTEYPVVFVSHRMSSAKLADTVLVLKNGSIAELGPFPALLEGNGYFAAMYRQQAEFYREEE